MPCLHPHLVIVHIATCGARQRHRPGDVCRDEDITARCRDCLARLVAFGWPAFDARRWARIDGRLTEHGHWWFEHHGRDERRVATEIAAT